MNLPTYLFTYLWETGISANVAEFDCSWKLEDQLHNAEDGACDVLEFLAVTKDQELSIPEVSICLIFIHCVQFVLNISLRVIQHYHRF